MGTSHPSASRMHHLGLRLALLLLFVVGLGSALPAQAQDGPKIAVVDLEALFFSAQEGQDLRKQLADLEKNTKAEVEGIAGRIQQMRQEAVGKSQTEQREMARRIEDEERAARRVAESAQREAARIEQAARDRYNERLEPILRQVQEEEGLDLILNKTPGVVVFASAAVDISQALLSKLSQ